MSDLFVLVTRPMSTHQNDVYGQVLVTLLPLFSDKRLKTQVHSAVINLVKHCLEMIETTMEEPDNGLWEFQRTVHNSIATLFCFIGQEAMLQKKSQRSIGDEDSLYQTS